MSGYRFTKAASFGLLLLSGCATHSGDNVTTNSPGYVALKDKDYPTATRDFKDANFKTPNNAYDELDLGASYQHQGRMDLAEPLYRQAMTHGHDLMPTDTTTKFSKGHTVEEIACQNLAMGLAPATVEGTATPCQTTLVVAVVNAPGPVAEYYEQTSYNTYFNFDKATLTESGRRVIQAASKQALANPSRRVELLGKASSVGTDSYNLGLSHERANTVRDAMIADGVPASKIDIRWVGERELAVPEKEGVHEPLNRVVQGHLQ